MSKKLDNRQLRQLRQPRRLRRLRQLRRLRFEMIWNDLLLSVTFCYFLLPTWNFLSNWRSFGTFWKVLERFGMFCLLFVYFLFTFCLHFVYFQFTFGYFWFTFGFLLVYFLFTFCLLVVCFLFTFCYFLFTFCLLFETIWNNLKPFEMIWNHLKRRNFRKVKVWNSPTNKLL